MNFVDFAKLMNQKQRSSRADRIRKVWRFFGPLERPPCREKPSGPPVFLHGLRRRSGQRCRRK